MYEINDYDHHVAQLQEIKVTDRGRFMGYVLEYSIQSQPLLISEDFPLTGRYAEKTLKIAVPKNLYNKYKTIGSRKVKTWFYIHLRENQTIAFGGFPHDIILENMPYSKDYYIATIVWRD